MPVPFQSRTVTNVPVIQAAAGNFDIAAAPGASLRVYVLSIVLVANGACTLKFQEGGTTDLTGNMTLGANGGMVVIGNGVDPVLSTAVANLKLNLVTATSFVNGWIRYFVDT